MNKKTKIIAAATLSTVLLTGCEASDLVKPLDNVHDWFVSVDPVNMDDESENVLGMMIAPTFTPNPDID